MFVFSFDLRSAYHHTDICDKHRKFLSFKWTSSHGVTKFYEFKVLPFGMCSAPYVFTKVLRQLVKYWRGCGHLTLMYLNDGLGGDMSFESTKSLSDTVCNDIVLSSFTPNNDKSVWQPTQKLAFLGTVLDFEEGFILIPERRILSLNHPSFPVFRRSRL